MIKFFQKIGVFVIFPSFVFTAAVFPFRCNVAKDGGVFRSQDYGATWEQKVKISDKQTIGGRNILSMAINPTNPGILYAGTESSGFYKSVNEGELWEQVQDENNVLDSRAAVLDIEINPRSPNIIYLAVYQDDFGRLLRSYDSGKIWEEVYVAPKEEVTLPVIEIDRRNEAIVYLGTSEGGILRSIDYGLSWQSLGWFSDEISDIKVDPRNNQIIYLVTSEKGIYKSFDQGGTWQELSLKAADETKSPFKFSSEGEEARGLIIDSGDSNVLYLVSEKGLLKSSDAGQSWQELNILMPSGSVSILAIAQDQQNPDNIYYGASSAVYRTGNAGQTWTVNQISSSRNVRIIKIDPLDPNIIYVGMHD